MFKKKGEEKSMFRAVKFEITPTSKQLECILRISGICRRVWNEALTERQAVFSEHIHPIYEEITSESKRVTEEGWKEKEKKELVRYLKYWLKIAFRTHPLPTYIDQQNALTEKIRSDLELQLILRSWIEQVLVELQGSFSSFISLRKKGDADALPPRVKKDGFFCDISGRSGFRVDLEDGTIRLSTSRVAGENFIFPIPNYQLEMLRNALGIKDFTLFRHERDMSKPGRFWIALAYEIPKPETTEFVPEEAVFVAIGSTRIGVVAQERQVEIPIGRPDMHWQPKIENVKVRMKELTKGSRRWKRLDKSRKKMGSLKARQQKQNRREIVQKLLKFGNHFVVTDLVIRSKPGRLADKTKSERGGILGLNWAAQNSGAIGALVAQLVIKAEEQGGTVQKHPMTVATEDKIKTARLLKESFLACQHNTG
jgi:hypothetical protein